jgi:hypothetical protein
MPWTPDHLSVKGALAAFHQAVESAPAIHANHTQTYTSTTDTEALTFPGFVPRPREFLDSRQFQGMRDFRYNVTNKEYELSLIVTRKNWEDDQTGLINQRFSETGEVWGEYLDYLFGLLLSNGNVSGNNGWDGTTFHSDSHAAGSSGLVIDNNVDENITTTTAITAAEFLTLTNSARTAYLSYNDDQGRPFNSQAISKIRFIVPPNHERGAYEAMNQVAFTGGSGATNVYGNAFIDGIDVSPYIAAATTEIFSSALGSVRKPFIHQERTPLEVIILSGGDEVAKNNGVMLLSRQRFLLTYGEFRRSILHTMT